MKHRNGFVSNSSSSSFIVAFFKKPRTVNAVLEFMFDGKEGGIGLEYYDNGLSYNQVSQIIYDDIKNGNAKKVNLKMLTEELMGRYYYHPNDGCYSFCNGAYYDEFGGYWYYKLGRYFGSNQKLMNKLRDMQISEAKKDIELREKEKAIMAESKIKEPKNKWAYKDGIDDHTKKPYTKKEIKDRERYDKEIENFQKTNPKYIAYRKEENDFRHDRWDKLEKLRRKIAECDAKNFLKDNQGKFIFAVSYSDNDGEQQSIMEHAKVFRNVPHIAISNH